MVEDPSVDPYLLLNRSLMRERSRLSLDFLFRKPKWIELRSIRISRSTGKIGGKKKFVTLATGNLGELKRIRGSEYGEVTGGDGTGQGKASRWVRVFDLNA